MTGRTLGLFWAWYRRDLRARYSQTLLGWAWALAQPMAYTLALVFLVNRVGAQSQGAPLPSFIYPAMLIWFLFTNATQGAMNGLAASMQIVAKVRFPRMIAPLSGACVPLIDFAIGCAFLPLVLLVQGTGRWPSPVFLVAALGSLLAAVALGTLLGAAAIFIRDLRTAVPFVMQVGLLATPVAYSLDRLPSWLSWNPLATFVSAARAAVIHVAAPDLQHWLVSVSVVIAVLAAAMVYFRVVEDRFADVA